MIKKQINRPSRYIYNAGSHTQNGSGLIPYLIILSYAYYDYILVVVSTISVNRASYNC